MKILSAVEGDVEAYFSPKGGLASKLITEIDKATISFHGAIFSFTLNEIADAIIRARSHGLDVKVIMDQHQSSEGQLKAYKRLKDARVEIFKSANRALMHNKYAIIDNRAVITGSYNWTRNAEERNNENLLILHLPKIAELFESNFKKVFQWHIQFYATQR